MFLYIQAFKNQLYKDSLPISYNITQFLFYFSNKTIEVFSQNKSEKQ